MKHFPFLISCLLLCSCVTDRRRELVDAVPFFMANPYDQKDLVATKIDQQKGKAKENRLSVNNFVEMTVAQGSGLEGYNSLRIFANGNVYAVYSEISPRPTSAAAKTAFTLSKAEIGSLLESLNKDDICKIQGLYSSGAFDGYQGFIEIKTTSGRRYCSLDNYFQPVAHTFDYCNRVVWPKRKSGRQIEDSADRTAEYYRIFKVKDSVQQ